MKRRWLSLSSAATFLVCALWSAPAAAFCSAAERSVFFLEFAEGSAELAPDVPVRFLSHMLPLLSGARYIDSYYVLASGDIAEGEEWEKAVAEARLADQVLAHQRIEAIKAMIRTQPPNIRSAVMEVKVRENKQVLSAAEQAASPEIGPRTTAGIAATIRSKAPAAPADRPVPTC